MPQGTPATPSPAHCSSCSTAKPGNGALREFAWDKEKYSRVTNLLPRCTWDGSTWTMPRHLQSAFPLPHHPSSPAGADLLPGIWHMVSLGPARAIMAAPTTVPPSLGSGKRISAKGSSCGSCSHPVVQAPRVRSRAAPRSPGYRMITS